MPLLVGVMPTGRQRFAKLPVSHHRTACIGHDVEQSVHCKHADYK
jgi:hypothetical protein